MPQQVSTQDYSSKNIRASAVLTTSYVAGAVLTGPTGTGMHLMNQLMIYIGFTKGSLTSASVKVEFSNNYQPDTGVGDWYQESFEAISGGEASTSAGVHTLTASGNYRLLLNIKDKYIKISAIGTGTVTNSLMDITAPYGVI